MKKFIIGTASLMTISLILLVSNPTSSAQEDDDLLGLIDQLEAENQALVIENDSLYVKNAELTKKYVTESFKKKDARDALDYMISVSDNDSVNQKAVSIALQDTASKYWDSRK